MEYNIGIRECGKCEHNLRCEECVFPEQVKMMYQEIAELRKDKYIVAEEIKALNELIKKLTEDINNFSKTNNAVRSETIREDIRLARAKARLLYLEGEPVDNNLYINIRDIESFLKEQAGERNE